MSSRPDQIHEEVFNQWWDDEGKRLCQSVLIGTENISVKEKMRQVFLAGFTIGDPGEAIVDVG